MSRTLLSVLFLAATGCVLGPTTIEHDSWQTDETFDRIVVASDAGDLFFTGTDGTRTEVAITRTYRRHRPDLSFDVRNGTLFVEVDCPEPLHSQCSADLDVALPAEVGDLDLFSGAGDVVLEGLDGDIVLDIGAGDILLEDLVGDIELETGAGDVTGIDLLSERFVGDTGAGDFDLDLVAAFEVVDVRSGAGDIDLRVPAGAYDIDTHTGVGSVETLDVMNSGSAESTISARTGAGDITIVGVEGGPSL